MECRRPRSSETTLGRMTAAPEQMTSEDGIVHAWQAVSSGEISMGRLDTARQLVDMGAVVVKLSESFNQRTPLEQPFGPVLIPLDEAVRKLASARETARMHGTDIGVFSCTEARRAVAICSDKDFRDRKYLSGMTYCGALHAYCGGLDAAISRALIYAPHADVVCFKSEVPDISEARRFATSIQASFPEKKLGFGYSPRPDGPKWNGQDHAAFQSELYSIGFDHYFFTQFGSAIFPHFPSRKCWVMFDDALKDASPITATSAHLPLQLRRSTEHS